MQKETVESNDHALTYPRATWIKIEREHSSCKASDGANAFIVQFAIEYFCLVGPTTPRPDKPSVVALTELGGIDRAMLPMDGTLMPRDVFDELATAEIPDLDLVLGPPAPCENHVIVYVHGITTDVGAVETADRLFHSQIPYLHGVVPPAAHNDVVVVRIEFEGEHAVGMTRCNLPETAAEGGGQYLGGFVIYAHLVVLPGRSKDASIAPVVNRVQLVLRVLDFVQTLTRGDMPVLHRSICVHGEKNVLGLGGAGVRSESYGRHGHPTFIFGHVETIHHLPVE